MAEEQDRTKQLATYASILVEDPNFKELLRALKNRTIRKWGDAKTVAAREECWHDLQAVGRLEHILADLPQQLALQKVKDMTRKPKNG